MHVRGKRGIEKSYFVDLLLWDMGELSQVCWLSKKKKKKKKKERLLAMRWTCAESYLVFLICRGKERESSDFLGYQNGTARVLEGGWDVRPWKL